MIENNTHIALWVKTGWDWVGSDFNRCVLGTGADGWVIIGNATAVVSRIRKIKFNIKST